jgi:hypothetical protein
MALIKYNKFIKPIRKNILQMHLNKIFLNDKVKDDYNADIFNNQGIKILYSMYTFNLYYAAMERFITSNVLNETLKAKLDKDIYIQIYNWYFEKFLILILSNEDIIDTSDNTDNYYLENKKEIYITLLYKNWLLLHIYNNKSSEPVIFYYIQNLYIKNLIDSLHMFDYNFIYYKKYFHLDTEVYTNNIHKLVEYMSLLYNYNLTDINMQTDFSEAVANYKDCKTLYLDHKKQILIIFSENAFKKGSNFNFNFNYLNLFLWLFLLLSILDLLKEDINDANNINDIQDITDASDVNNIKYIEDTKDIKDTKDTKDTKDINDTQDTKDTNDTQDTKDINDT